MKRLIARSRLVLLVVVISIATALSVSAVVNDTTADRVLGQPDFTHGSPNFPDAIGLAGPQGVAVDTSVTPNRVYVADTANNRVLGYSNIAMLTNGSPANLVIGQPDFNSTNVTPVNASSLNSPIGIAVDAAGNLYVADMGNLRVLEYDSPFTTDTVADRVFGQPDFLKHNVCTLGASGLCLPQGVALDLSGHLYVADTGNNRVLEYDSPLTSQNSDSGSSKTVECTLIGPRFGSSL